LQGLAVDVDTLIARDLDDARQITECAIQFLQDDVALRSQLQELTIGGHLI
jgi:CRISPR/Cas system Type II protein with McrA/HNH and RuvC-like nuclease domain